jgi:tripartite-type tricarboxylate transporter receptor subunit TctC
LETKERSFRVKLVTKLCIAASISCLSVAGAARAQSYPTRPITIVVGYAAGGTHDIVARTVSASMAKTLGTTFVVENRPGAGGTVGATSVVRSEPNGYTIGVVGTLGVVLGPRLIRKQPFTTKDFVAIGSATDSTMTIEVQASSKWKTFKEFIDFAKANPEQVRIGHAGVGSTNHIAILEMQERLGVKFTSVPYRGSGPAIADLLGGNIDAVVDQIPSSIGQLKAGAFRPLAVTTLKRSDDLPDVPTIDELGVKGFEVPTTSGLIAPANTPPAIINALSGALNKALDDPEVQKQFRTIGADVRKTTPEQFSELIRKEDARAEDLIKKGLFVIE